MTYFDGPNQIITLDDPTTGILNISVEIDIYTPWKEWVLGRYFFDTEDDVNGTTERITYIDHGLYTGQAVKYYVDLGTEDIGLVDDTEYFVRADFNPGPAYNRNEFELYDTKDNAEAAEPTKTGRIDLTASGGGNGETHRIAADNSKFLPAFRNIGGDPLTPGVEAGPYFFLQNQAANGWRIISTDENQTINYQGNLLGEDSSESLINVTPGRTVLHLGLQPVTQRVDEILNQTQLGLYSGVVTIDTKGNGESGTEFPIGTESVPVDNLADALTIANNLGFNRFTFRGNISFTSASGDTLWSGAGADAVIDVNGQDITGTHFVGLVISGAIAPIFSAQSPINEITMNGCVIGALTGFRGTIQNSAIDGPIQLVSGNTRIINSLSNIAGGTPAVIDADDETGINLIVRGYNGGIQLENFTQSDAVGTIGINTGKITIAANCTDFSDLQVRGVATLSNLSAIASGIGKIIETSSLLDATDVLIAKQMVAGNVTIAPDDLTVTVYDEDGTTVLVVLDVSADGRIRTRTT